MEKTGRKTGSQGSKAAGVAVDIALALVATLLMMRSHFPAMLHQLAGIAFGALTAVHMWQHRAWLSGLFRGKLKGAKQAISAAGMAAILLCGIALIASGLMMSTWASALDIAGGTGAARALHLPLSHLLYCIIGLHAGICMKGAAELPRPALAAWAAIAAVGVWSFIALDFAGYITGAAAFAFIDPSKPVALSFIQYLSVFALFALAGTSLSQALSRGTTGKRGE